MWRHCFLRRSSQLSVLIFLFLCVNPVMAQQSRVSISASASIAPPQLLATPGTIQDNLEKLHQAFIQRKGFSVKFEQLVYSSLRNKLSKSEGVLQAKPPLKFRWEIVVPQNELYVSNGQVLWKYNPQFKHAQRLDLNAVELNFLHLLVNPKDLQKDYKVDLWKKAFDTLIDKNIPSEISDTPPASQPELFFVKLEPRIPSRQKVIYAVINTAKNFIQELRIVFENGNRTKIVFFDFQEVTWNDKNFEFEPPAGTAVDKN